MGFWMGALQSCPGEPSAWGLVLSPGRKVSEVDKTKPWVESLPLMASSLMREPSSPHANNPSLLIEVKTRGVREGLFFWKNTKIQNQICYLKLLIGHGAGEMVQWLRALALAEDPGSVPSIHTSGSWWSVTWVPGTQHPLLTSWVETQMWCASTHTKQNKPYKKKASIIKYKFTQKQPLFIGTTCC